MSDERPNRASSQGRVGVLAFGSLIWDPGCLQEHIIAGGTREVLTPWPVEYARKSRSRGYAPTLVKVVDGWRVNAKILVLDICDEETARSLVACRERLGESRRHLIQNCLELEAEHRDLAAVLYSHLKPNICETGPCADELTALAVGSFQKLKDQAKDENKNGIRYLNENIKHGVVTALTCEYKQALLEKCGVCTLREAEKVCLQGMI